MRSPKGGGFMTKHVYVVSYYDEEGNERLMEVPAYSAEQAEFLSGRGNVISVEETVRKDRRCMEEY